MVSLVALEAPGDGILHRQEDTVACVGDQDLGKGCIYISESSLKWLNTANEGFTLEYPSISLHAISRDQNTFPKPCLYVMFDGKLNSSGSGESDEEDEGEVDPEPEVTEIRFVPEDVNSLESMYTALCDAQVLHPDENDSFSDDDEYYEGGSEPFIITASGDQRGLGVNADGDLVDDEGRQVGVLQNNGQGDTMDVDAPNDDNDGQFEDVDE